MTNQIIEAAERTANLVRACGTHEQADDAERVLDALRGARHIDVTTEATESGLRENVRQALHVYRDHYVTRENDQTESDPEHVLVSRTQIDSAMRVLWMD